LEAEAARSRDALAHGIGDHHLASSLAMTTIRPTDSAVERLRRLRSLAWLLDNSIPLPGGWRIGLDALIGLVPGIGDAIGAVLSAFIINEARVLGAPRSVLVRMAINVLIETVIGAIPFAGDLFDAAYKANAKNVALLERYQLDPTGSRRSSRAFVFFFSLALILFVLAMIALPVLIVVALVQLF
jgi:hypothetical protein